MQLSVIIVNYNVKYFLEQCLCSIIKAVENIKAEIFVIDNDSSDGSNAFFKDRFTNVNFIWNDENIGFAKANNIAVRKATGKYILFLNPDTILPEDCFEKCFLFFENNTDAGALGIKMLDGSGNFLKESKRSFPSPVTSFFKLSGLSDLFPHSKKFSKYHLGNFDENKNHEVDVIAGAFMMVPKNIIDTTGSFDEDYFMYGEDIDLSYRIQKAGYKNYYFAESSIIHFKGESTRKGRLNYVKLFYQAMSIFARKHYGMRAPVFNILIQIAILSRAAFSALLNFIKWIGMPVVDAIIILSSFWLTKLFWNVYVKKDVNYSPHLLIIALPVFTLIFLAMSYYTGLYDNGFKQKRLNHSTLIAFLVLLCVYALVPEKLRFSRGILVLGSLLAFVLLTIVKWVLVKLKVIESDNKADDNSKTFIAGAEQEFKKVNNIMQTAGMQEKILGRIGIDKNDEINSIGNIEDLNILLTTYPTKEVIFCAGNLSFKKIIDTIDSLKKKVRIKFYAASASGIIGSDSKNTSGRFISYNQQIKLLQPVSRRNKALIDVIICLLFIISFPVHLFTQKSAINFYKNVFGVLFNYKTWVGCAIYEHEFRYINEGILTTTGLPRSLNTLPKQSLQASDKWYAIDYTIWEDVKLVFEGYRYLSI